MDKTRRITYLSIHELGAEYVGEKEDRLVLGEVHCRRRDVCVDATDRLEFAWRDAVVVFLQYMQSLGGAYLEGCPRG